MATLTIAGTQQEAKFGFAFKNLADKNYNQKDDKGNEVGGFNGIYTGLLQYDIDALKAFWDCGLAHLKKRPSITDIEEALEARIEEDGDTDQLFKEAFREIDASGFFKKSVTTFWKNLELFKGMARTEAEKKENAQGVQMLLDAKTELLA
ncbi:tail assembly chaperone [Lysinibacillus sp. 1 U-2021]|uniref:tail assembly chaperone n=1 Tax=Lysinibacillus sp. 1 U-2021 TaxID=3039426 RepID=UPI00247FF422|nr:tail assembly chaperone [Lysinibacillus sp. 1 U-2021]WGT40147.1 tail assembly chaperone [Lysinibacillus sp. 1 U-2021]